MNCRLVRRFVMAGLDPAIHKYTIIPNLSN